jgi:ATP-dependent DNA helicase RecQ
MYTLNSFFHAVRYALDKLEYEDIFLKVKQYQVLASLLEKRDTVAILPTGYGKSLIFHLFPFVYDYINISTLSHRHGCAALIVTPLNSLISDQTSILKKRGIEAAVLTTTITSTEKHGKYESSTSECESDEEEAPETQSMRLLTDEKTKQNIDKENFKIIFAHPEAFISCKEGRRLLLSNSFQHRIVASVIDEAHLVEEWGREFRPDFSKLAQLGSIFPNAPFLILTATAPLQMRDELICTLHLKKPFVVVANLNRPNIFIEKKKRKPASTNEESFDSILLPIARELKKSLILFPLTIIYLPLKWCGYAFKLFMEELEDKSYIPSDERIPKNCLFAQYHSPQTEEMKLEILSQLKGHDSSRKTRVVFATVAIGLGVDIPDVRHIVHIGPPCTLESYYQEIGRAGRDGKQAHASLYYNGHDIASNKRGMTEEVRMFCREESGCLRNIILRYLGSNLTTTNETDRHLCCSNCLKMCKCNSCEVLQPLNESLTITDMHEEPHNPVPQPSCNILKSQQDKIRTLMREYRLKLGSEGYQMGGIDASTGLTLKMIDSIVANFEFVKSAEEMVQTFGIWDIDQANSLFKIITKVCQN